MSDSIVTKRALAQALRFLMAEKPLKKISVGEICERCNMNRKSFYYHFQDKYELVSWIFDQEIGEKLQTQTYPTIWDMLRVLCKHLYDSHTFYTNALLEQGQNSFGEYLSNTLCACITPYMQELVAQTTVHHLQIELFADAFTLSVYKWLCYRPDLTPEQYVAAIQY